MPTISIKSARAWIPAHRVEELQATLTFINRRAAKLGCAPATLATFGTEERVVRGPAGKVNVQFVEVEVVGEMPKFPGWRLIAVVSHEDQIVDVVPGETLPEGQRARGPVCDHCARTDARRKKTMVLASDDDTKVVQVGTTCIGAFLGSTDYDPQAALVLAQRVFSLLGSFGDLGDDFFAGGWREVTYVPLREVLLRTSQVLAHSQWVSRAKAREPNAPGPATADAVIEVVFPAQPMSAIAKKWWTEIVETPVDETEIDRACAWVIAQCEDAEKANDYLLNLLAIVEADRVAMRRFGYACSILPAYRRAAEREAKLAAEAAGRLDEHFGEVGTRYVLALKVTSDPRAIDSAFGTSFLHSFSDADGRVFKWFGSARLRVTDDGSERPVRAGDEVVVKATVKKHGSYNGWKETGLSRVAIAPPPKAKKSKTKVDA